MKGCLKWGCALFVVVIVVGIAGVMVLANRIADPKHRARIAITNSCKDEILITIDGQDTDVFRSKDIHLATGGKHVHYTLKGPNQIKVFNVGIIRFSRKGKPVAKNLMVTYRPNDDEFCYTENNRLELENGRSVKGLVKESK